MEDKVHCKDGHDENNKTHNTCTSENSIGSDINHDSDVTTDSSIKEERVLEVENQLDEELNNLEEVNESKLSLNQDVEGESTSAATDEVKRSEDISDEQGATASAVNDEVRKSEEDILDEFLYHMATETPFLMDRTNCMKFISEYLNISDVAKKVFKEYEGMDENILTYHLLKYWRNQRPSAHTSCIMKLLQTLLDQAYNDMISTCRSSPTQPAVSASSSSTSVRHRITLGDSQSKNTACKNKENKSSDPSPEENDRWRGKIKALLLAIPTALYIVLMFLAFHNFLVRLFHHFCS